ncbi:MAG: hypothetical protein IJE07_09175 [Clostridia bacterium]|nr:hypothetical protein [Clostridia bacterium]
MNQPADQATLEVYQLYHVPVNVQRDRRTYDHFASAHSRTLRQEQLLTTYLQEMVAAITREVNEGSTCWLLQAIVRQELPAIHLLDRSAIACVYASVFTPQELPRLDTRSIPYSSAFSSSPGGMRYADRNARTAIVDLRADAALHPLCHALLAHARASEQALAASRSGEEARQMHHQLISAYDDALGLRQEIARLEQELAEARQTISALTPAPADGEAGAPMAQ